MKSVSSAMAVMLLLLFSGVAQAQVTVSQLEVFPKQVKLKPSAKVEFTVLMHMSDGTVKMPENNVAWIVTGGNISPEGVFKAGTRQGYYALTVVHESYSATAQIQVSSGQPQQQRLRILNEAPVLAIGQKFQFKAQGVTQGGGSTEIKAEWSITGGGTIDKNGVFTAEREGNFFVVVRDGNRPNAQNMVATTNVRVVRVNPVFMQVDQAQPQPQPNNNNNNGNPVDLSNQNPPNNNNPNNVQPPVQPQPQPEPQLKPVKVTLERWDIGNGNFLRPWAKASGKIEGSNLSHIELVAYDFDGDGKVIRKQDVKHGDNFKLEARYERFGTSKIQLRLIDKNGKVVAQKDERL